MSHDIASDGDRARAVDTVTDGETWSGVTPDELGVMHDLHTCLRSEDVAGAKRMWERVSTYFDSWLAGNEDRVLAQAHRMELEVREASWLRARRSEVVSVGARDDHAREQYIAFMAAFEITAGGTVDRTRETPATDIERAKAAGRFTGLQAYRSAKDAARRRYGWSP